MFHVGGLQRLLLVVAAAFPLASTSSALYAYVPNVLVLSTGDDADTFLSQLEVSLGVQPAEDPIYADRPELKRLDRTTRVMEKHWERLDRECDANAVFALTYLTTTYGIRAHVLSSYFADNDYLAIITVSFAKLYLDAYDQWARGNRESAPLPWLEAFDAATAHNTTVLEDEFLGINAHINYDLAVAIAALGTTDGNGDSRKPDMDRVNHVLADVTDDVSYNLAKYYGPSPPTAEPNWGEGHSPETELTLEPVYAWREHAWNNALAIETMPDSQTRAAHDASMQQHAWTVAQGFQSAKLSDPWPERLAYCQVNP